MRVNSNALLEETYDHVSPRKKEREALRNYTILVVVTNKCYSKIIIIASIVDIQIIRFIKYTLYIFIFNYSGFPFEMNQLS